MATLSSSTRYWRTDAAKVSLSCECQRNCKASSASRNFGILCHLQGISDREANKLDVIHFTHAFHGRTGYTLSLTNTGETKTKWYPKFDWTRATSPATNLYTNVEQAETLSLELIESTLKHGLVAAIILEPIQSEGGDNHFRKEFLIRLRQLADEYEAMLILDEVQTGVGLTGKMWCYEHFGMVPDMIAFGKKTQVCGFCSTNRIDSVPTNVFTVSTE